MVVTINDFTTVFAKPASRMLLASTAGSASTLLTRARLNVMASMSVRPPNELAT